MQSISQEQSRKKENNSSKIYKTLKAAKKRKLLKIIKKLINKSPILLISILKKTKNIRQYYAYLKQSSKSKGLMFIVIDDEHFNTYILIGQPKGADDHHKRGNITRM